MRMELETRLYTAPQKIVSGSGLRFLRLREYIIKLLGSTSKKNDNIGRVAHRLERRPYKPMVVGSIPTAPTGAELLQLHYVTGFILSLSLLHYLNTCSQLHKDHSTLVASIWASRY